MYPGAGSGVATSPFSCIGDQDAAPVSSAMFQDPTNTALVLEHGGSQEKTYATSGSPWSYPYYYIGCTGGSPNQTGCATGPTGSINVTTGTDGIRYISTDSKYIGNIYEPHLGTTNVLWADGHVKAMRLEDLIVTGTATAGTNQLMKYFTIMAD